MELPSSSLMFIAGSNKEFKPFKPFHKLIQVLNSEKTSQISIIDLIHFLESLPAFYVYHRVGTPSEDGTTKIDIQCRKCNNQKIFQIVLKTSQNSSEIFFSSMCNHINVRCSSTHGKKSVFSFHFDDGFDKLCSNAKRSFHHPFCFIGKKLYTSNTSQIIKDYLEKKVYSTTKLRELNASKRNTHNLNEFINSQKGVFRIRLFTDNLKIKDLLTLNGKEVQTFCWIAEWTFNLVKPINRHLYLQIDASFYSLYPYVYCIPLLIIDNASLPLGLVMGPSEHKNLFFEFFDLLKNIDNDSQLKNIPILSDEGKAIQSFVNENQCQQFFCYRHLIEKIGAHSILGIITRRLLFQPTLEKFQNELPQSISDVNYLISNNYVDQKSVEKFVRVFDLKISNGLIENNYVANHRHGLWNRSMLGISTCSNHVERLHRTLNEKTNHSQSILTRLSIVFNEIHQYYFNFEENSRRQSILLYKKFLKNANKKNYEENQTCPFDCNWGQIYSDRFGIANFPCKHTVLGVSIDFQNIKLEISARNLHIVQIHDSFENWTFMYKAKQKMKSNFDFMKECINSRNDNEYKSFIFQTASEIHQLMKKKISKNDIIFDLAEEWTKVTLSMNESEKSNIEFRSDFRIKMMKKFLERNNQLL